MGRMNRVDVGGTALEVLHLPAPTGAPARAPIVFLHEGLGSVAMWRDWPAQVCAATGRAGWVYSRQGYGASDPVPDVRGEPVEVAGQRQGRLQPDYMHHEAFDVLPRLLSKLGFQQPPDLLGHSDGASIALLHAAHFAKSSRGWLWPDGRALSVCLAVPTGTRDLVAAGAVVRRQLVAQGVGVDWTRARSVGSVIGALRSGTCSSGIVTRTGDGFVTHAAADWLVPRRPVPTYLTWTGVNDPIVSAAAITATGMLNPVTAVTTWTDMDVRLWNLMVGLPLYSPSVYVGWSPQIAGVLQSDTVGGIVDQIPSLLPTTSKP